ncbi:MAG: hypothetical protein U0Q16_08685 [Bryobacteraceae bacterium]
MTFLGIAAAWLLGGAWLEATSRRGGLWTRVWNAAAGLPLGLGVTSFLYFVLTWAGVRSALPQVALEAVAIAAGVYLWLRRGPLARERAPAGVGYVWALAIAAGIAWTLALAAVMTMSSALPHGDWDAWSIWNVRAKFLAGPGESWRHAVSPMFRSHPDYPLLLSGAVARLWRFSGSMDASAPAALALAFGACVPAMLVSALAVVRSTSMGWVASLLLVSGAGWLVEIPSQYADVPLSAFILAAVAAALMDRYTVAGVLISCAAWTKNEGMVFALALVIACAALRRDRIREVLLGAAPGLIVVALFKAMLAPASEYGAHAPELGRIVTILGSLWTETLNFGTGFAHPVIIAAALTVGLRFTMPAYLSVNWMPAVAACVVQCIGYLAAYLTTPADVAWQLSTSLGRLMAQMWPVLVLLLVAAMRTLEEADPAPVASKQADTKQAKKRTH